jgi:hypothetical protein
LLRPPRFATLLLCIFATASPSTAGEASRAAERPAYDVRGRIAARGEGGAAAGGDFALTGEIRAATPAAGDYRLNAFPASDLAFAPDGALCFCGDVIFTDDFETGNSAAWSETVP